MAELKRVAHDVRVGTEVAVPASTLATMANGNATHSASHCEFHVAAQTLASNVPVVIFGCVNHPAAPQQNCLALTFGLPRVEQNGLELPLAFSQHDPIDELADLFAQRNLDDFSSWVFFAGQPVDTFHRQ
jgi:hypothetical protein